MYVVTADCIDCKDKACVEVCPVDCIYEGQSMLYIHPDECIDCGACEPVCPQSAIVEGDAAQRTAPEFVEAAQLFFESLGSPDGASGVDFSDLPHPLPLPPTQVGKLP